MATKTKEKITNAFEEYIDLHQHLSGLNVRELASLTGINRVTFYRQFTDLNDFIKWYILKDFIFHHATANSFSFKDAFERIFEHIRRKRHYLKFIFESNFSPVIRQFVEQEILAYQLRNFNHIDRDNTLSSGEVFAHASFYASGLTTIILQYILLDKVFDVDPDVYTAYSLRIVKDYVERAIARKKAKAYDGIKESHS